jgi:hypothetical protein
VKASQPMPDADDTKFLDHLFDPNIFSGPKKSAGSGATAVKRVSTASSSASSCADTSAPKKAKAGGGGVGNHALHRSEEVVLKGTHMIDELLSCSSSKQLPSVSKICAMLQAVSARLDDKLMPIYIEGFDQSTHTDGTGVTTHQGMSVLEMLRKVHVNLQLAKSFVETFVGSPTVPATDGDQSAVESNTGTNIVASMKIAGELKLHKPNMSKNFVLFLWTALVADALALVTTSGSASASAAPTSATSTAPSSMLDSIADEGCIRWANTLLTAAPTRALPADLFDVLSDEDLSVNATYPHHRLFRNNTYGPFFAKT